MRKILNIVAVLIAVSGCVDFGSFDPYASELNSINVTLEYPEGMDKYLRSGVAVSFQDVNNGNSYTFRTNAFGRVSGKVSDGNYRVIVSDRIADFVFNGSVDKVIIAGKDISLNVPLIQSFSGPLVIKEIYCGGCQMYPLEGEYQSDKYIIIHNNDVNVQYLDGLCFATLDPYNSTAQNVWLTTDPGTGEKVLPDFVPIIQAIWQFGGDGDDFPLQPGEDAVLCCCGAIDHTVMYPLSVNLNKPGYFVCYNSTYFPNTLYHPAPGTNISQDRILDVVIKLGQSNAYTLSISSPAVVLFRAQETTIQEFVQQAENITDKPGSKDRIVKLPPEWVIDAVEVFTPGSNNTKRLRTELDAGYVTLSGTLMGHSLFRKTDEQATTTLGYEVLQDTNNSQNDFYELERASLYEE